ncbi:DUF2786 domain-containing protein [Pseudomonas sp. B21-044]|uniref:DUF2786 domain-containing protein n=1 Tax=Pseudomonas sp. B21-044 TaxID=2895488 RepID=UPI00215F8ED6|nr:DUF2786 domain-containing protein [Pseudomonas sp. B21-044]UVL19621.1 DUF2786 domain-containing protein [Pseudomonas sp. B21-044]
MTQTIDQKVQDKLRKLQALAERGVGGEKVNAQRMLERLLERHGLTLEDLADERRETRWFPAPTRFDVRLAAQILAKLCNTNAPGVYRSKNRPKQVGVDVTPAEAIEFELHYDILRKALTEHFKDAFSAFIQANRLYSNLPSDESSSAMSERVFRILSMAAATPATSINTRIAHSKEVAHG